MLSLTTEGFNQFIEKLPSVIACFDDKRRYIALNEACAEVNGVSKKDTIGKTIEEVLPDLVDTLSPIFDKVYLHNESVSNKLIEGKTPASDQIRYWLANYQPFDFSNGKRGLLVTAEEITSEVFAKRSAETNKRLLTNVLDSLLTFVGLLDVNGVVLDANKAPLTAAGLKLSDVKGKHFWDCFWWSYSSAVQASIKRAIHQVLLGKPVRFDIDARVADGFITIDLMMEVLKDDKGTVTHIIPSAIDISERKKTEQQLKLSQSRFETVINRTIDALVAFDTEGTIQFSNKRFEELTKLSVEIGKSKFFSYINDPRLHKRFADIQDKIHTVGIHEAITESTQYTPQDVCSLLPTNTPVEVALSPLLDGKEVLFLATISDVSALYEANQSLQKALEEKTVLLNEVHHRVKNNLQVMSSLLNLQANAESTDAKTRDALLDSQRRLKSMALIHELLYEREDFTHASLQLFVDKLLDLLRDSMADTQQVSIQKDFATQSIAISLNQMVPLGFLLTELLTNAFKHAFKGVEVASPTVSIKIYTCSDLVDIIVSDNGKGMGGAMHKNTGSLGQELIDIFAKQLKATLISTDGKNNQSGVTHTISFRTHAS
uniref:PAS domain S-box protein n=1 Tax=Ningiella ruwaisensis TaxID=2364274 RepID=UPI00109F6232|nr:PAS domain S-box protein [Ningiella ruwaisensis]